jgi:hypothetical protein
MIRYKLLRLLARALRGLQVSLLRVSYTVSDAAQRVGYAAKMYGEDAQMKRVNKAWARYSAACAETNSAMTDELVSDQDYDALLDEEDFLLDVAEEQSDILSRIVHEVL